MATVIGTGISTRLDSFAAGKEAALNAYYNIGRNDPSLVITFISTIFDQKEAINGIHSIIKDVPMIGCSSIGSISTHGSKRDSVSVFIISSDSIEFSCGIGHEVSGNARIAGHQVARKASDATHRARQAFVMFSSCKSKNSADILRGSQEVLGTSFPIMGGGACDRSLAQCTYQYIDNQIETDSVIGVTISGNIRLGTGQANSWQPIGKPHKITKAKSNIIKEIDKRIAVELYEEYFGQSFEELKSHGICRIGVNYPIGMRLEGNGNSYLTRVPLAIEENGSIVLNADMPEGEYISLMIGDKDLVVESAKKAAMEALGNIKNENIRFAIVFSDIARLLLLRNNADKEIDAVKEVIGRNIPIIGCYTLGEYAVLNEAESKGQCYFNNHSVFVALFSE